MFPNMTPTNKPTQNRGLFVMQGFCDLLARFAVSVVFVAVVGVKIGPDSLPPPQDSALAAGP